MVEESREAAGSISELLLVPPGELTKAQVALLKLKGVWGDLLDALQAEGGQVAEDYLRVFEAHGWAGVIERLLFPLLRGNLPWVRTSVGILALAEAFTYYHHRWRLRRCRYGPHLFVGAGRGAPAEVCPAHQPLALRERVYRHREKLSTQRKVGNTLATPHVQKGASRRKGTQKRAGRNPHQK